LKNFIAIDMIETGKRIKTLMISEGYNINDLKVYLCLKNPQAIYKWFSGKSIPSLDFLFALSKLFNVHMDELLVGREINYTSEIEAKKETPKYE